MELLVDLGSVGSIYSIKYLKNYILVDTKCNDKYLFKDSGSGF